MRAALLSILVLAACGGAPPIEGPVDAAASVDAASCAGPLGSSCRPIPIDRLPFRHQGDTAGAAESLSNGYSCAIGTDESGREVHYELRLSAPARVSFAIAEAEGADVDVHVLRTTDPASCVARANTTLEQPLAAGAWRIVIDSYEMMAGGYTLDVSSVEPAPRTLGTMWNTFYFLADEDDYEGAHDVPIFDAQCRELARVTRGFHDSVCIEGSGRLADERIINVDGSCTTSCPAAQLCGSHDYRICYAELDRARYPFGRGAGAEALEPDRSMAVDRTFVPLGSWVYFEELDGMARPGTSEPHDGCLRADDVGGGIDGNQFDFFAGTRARWLEWESTLPTRSTLHAWVDEPRCYPAPLASRR